MLHLAISTLGVLHLEAGRAHVAFTIGLVEPFSRRSEGEPASTEVLVGDAFRAGANSAPPRYPGGKVRRDHQREGCGSVDPDLGFGVRSVHRPPLTDAER